MNANPKDLFPNDIDLSTPVTDTTAMATETTLLNPRFYTTDFDEMDKIDVTPVREDWDKRKGEWLPTGADRAYVATLQKPVTEPGRIANWIARPARGIKGLPFEYEYVRLD